MNEIVSKFLLVGDKFMPEMHLKQPGFTYSACGPFTKNKELKNFCKLEIQILFIEMSFIEMLDNIVDKYNNTVHRTIKMKPIDIMGDAFAEYSEDFNKKILNSKFLIMLEFQNIKTFLLKDILQIGQKKFLLLVKLKMQFLGHT